MITYDQAMTSQEFHLEPCTRTVGPRGGIKESTTVYRRNGKTQTWKTRPGEFRIPVKHGLRNYDSITNSDVDRVHTREDCPLNNPS